MEELLNKITSNINELYADKEVFKDKPLQEEIQELQDFFMVRTSNRITRGPSQRTLVQKIYVAYTCKDIYNIGINVLELINKLGSIGSIRFLESDEDIGRLAGVDDPMIMITLTYEVVAQSCLDF